MGKTERDTVGAEGENGGLGGIGEDSSRNKGMYEPGECPNIARLIDERHQQMEWTIAVLDKVRTTLQMQAVSYETQAVAVAALIEKLKIEK